MNRELLEKMTKEELMELVRIQDEAINSLDIQRYDSSAVIEHLVRVTHDMHNLRYYDAERSHCQDHLDDFVREMYMKYPMYIVSAEKVDKMPDEPFKIIKEQTDDTNGQMPEGGCTNG